MAGLFSSTAATLSMGSEPRRRMPLGRSMDSSEKKERIVHFAKGCVVGKTDCDTMLHQEVSHSLQPNQTNKGKYRHENFRVGG
mmetsp:Transcript_2020/g.4851  ORF Transcript_2020/g.4851 Transcript_2020/m.4851 type:complete len:83 (-) Transcript_2020:519-767(-)